MLAGEHNGPVLLDLLAERIAKEALFGKLAFVKEVLDRLEGQVPRPVGAATEGAGPCTVVFCIVEAVPPSRPPPRPPPLLPGDGRENVRVLGE